MLLTPFWRAKISCSFVCVLEIWRGWCSWLLPNFFWLEMVIIPSFKYFKIRFKSLLSWYKFVGVNFTDMMLFCIRIKWVEYHNWAKDSRGGRFLRIAVLLWMIRVELNLLLCFLKDLHPLKLDSMILNSRYHLLRS